MKSTKVWILAAMAITGLSFASCSDKEEETEPAAAQVVAGSYKGALIMQVGGTADTVKDATVVLAKENDNSVSVTVPAYGEGRMAIASYTVAGVSVAKSGSAYKLSKEDYSVTAGSMECKGSLSGTVSGGKLALDYTCTPGAMPMAINFTFTQAAL